MASFTPNLEKNSHARRSMPLFNSPKIRKSIGAAALLTPAIQFDKQQFDKLTNSASTELDFQNNDEAELRERQKQRAAELQQQNMSSPATPMDRRKSMGVATGMTNAALAEHYANCIKMSAENKINMKNAFNLQLIDCMSEMLRKRDPEMNNFQAASCTLDASTKIYAYRVDCVHIDTLKMAGGLGRTGNECSAGPENAHNEEADGPLKKKTRRKNKKTIESNSESINLSKFEIDYDVDPLFKKNSAMFDEGRNGGVNFLTSLSLKDDGCQLVLDSDIAAVNSNLDCLMKCCIGRITGLEEAEICQALKGFSFTSWNPTDDDILGRLQSPTKRKMNDYQTPDLPATSEDHVFDLDAVPSNNADSFNETHIGMEDIDEEEGVVERRTAEREGNFDPILATGKDLGIIELKDQLSTFPREYSYFTTTARSAWAGPLHWKFKSAAKHVEANARDSKKKRRKDPLYLEFDKPLDYGNSFNPARNTSKLTTTTLIQWLPEKITLPEDLQFDVKEFTRTFMRPRVYIHGPSQGSSQDVEDALAPYDYANRRDTENFCPPVNADSDSEFESDQNDPGMTFNAFGDQTEFVSQPDQTNLLGQFSGDNMVAAPNMVAKIQINYARVAKKMDMRRLKSTMWTMLNRSSKPENQAIPSKCNEKPFTETYRDIPSLLPQKMAENLSVALAFAALLHLANENCLHLEQTYGHLDDFKIVHEQKE